MKVSWVLWMKGAETLKSSHRIQKTVRSGQLRKEVRWSGNSSSTALRS